ncbi:hypothetical protein [Companilactobacillus kimchiensis]|uniref:Transposase n=1 Tax=Companilactobacillus kimchiensis TaxID=993692 RepID=A0A0R2L9Z0_9LACO|nr:hypothetical protein [Companilactobacillus kimchiensis]KRN98642.1 hypothetical protein IV57_GL001061 [Companilactobacillus kimchiensis]
MLTPEDIHQDMKEYNEEKMALLRENPWLIPTSLLITTIPFAVSAYGFWRNRQLQKKLKIEREKTKQMALKQVLPKNHQFKF